MRSRNPRAHPRKEAATIKDRLVSLGILGLIFDTGIIIFVTHSGVHSNIELALLCYLVGGGMMIFFLIEIWILDIVRPVKDPEFWEAGARWQIKFAVTAWSPISLLLVEFGIYPHRTIS